MDDLDSVIKTIQTIKDAKLLAERFKQIDDKVTNYTEAVKNAIENVKKDITTLNKEAKETKLTSIEAVKTAIEAINETLSELNQKIEAVDRNNERLEREIIPTYEGSKTQIDTSLLKVETFQKQIQNLQSTTSKAENTIKTIVQMLGLLPKPEKNRPLDLTPITKQLENLNNSQTEINKALELTRSEQTKMFKDIETFVFSNYAKKKHKHKAEDIEGGLGGTWGSITGALSDQTDLKAAIDDTLYYPGLKEPKSYFVDSGTLVESFDSLTGWTTSGGSGVIDTTYYVEGTGSLKITTPSGGSSINTKTISENLSSQKPLRFWIYVKDPTKLLQLQIIVSSSATFASFFNYVKTSGFVQGWNEVFVYRDDWTNTGGESWNNTMVRLRIRPYAVASQVAVVYMDDLRKEVNQRAKIIFTFDDSQATDYTEAYQYMKQYGFKGTSFIITGLINTAGYLNDTQMQEMYDYGWDLSNHTKGTYTNLTLAPDQEAMEYELQHSIDYITAKGWARRDMAYHFAYPQGQYNATVLAALANRNIISARTTVNKTQPHQIADPYLLNREALSLPISYANAQGFVDEAIATGSAVILNLHKLVVSKVAEPEWNIADFRALVDYIKTKVDANLCDVVPLTEWWYGLAGVRRAVGGGQRQDTIIGLESDLANTVKLTDDQTVAGIKTFTNAIKTTDIQASSSSGVHVKTNGGSDVLIAGAGGGVNATFYGNVSMNTTNKIVNMADPTSAQDGATKSYTDRVSHQYLTKVSGRFYTTPLCWGASTGSAVSTGTVFLMPYFEVETTTYDQIAINVTSAGTNIRFGIWNASSLALISDSGNVTASLGDAVHTFGMPITLTAGLEYWIGFTVDANTTVRFHPTNDTRYDLGSSNASTGAFRRAQFNLAYGALTDPLPALTLSTNGAPAIFLRKQ